MIDLTGKRFGALVALRPVPSSETRDHRMGWLCRCDCGAEKVVNAGNLRTGKITSCGCHVERGKRRSAAGNPKAIVDYTGQTINELTALRRVGRGVWLWRCSCGNEITAKPATVKAGKIQSCGHILAETGRSKCSPDGANVVQHFDGTLVSVLRKIVNSSTIHGIREVRQSGGIIVWQARINLRGKQITLGTFRHREEAEEARRDAERKYYRPIIEEWDRLHPPSKEHDAENAHKS